VDFLFIELFVLVSLCTCFNSSNETANCVFFGGFGGFLEAVLKHWDVIRNQSETTILDKELSDCHKMNGKQSIYFVK